MGTKRPGVSEIAAMVIAAGGNATVGADSAISITDALQKSADINVYAEELNNAIKQKYNDLHSDKTIYDKFKTESLGATIQSVVYERLSPVNFTSETDQNTLPADERRFAKKKPAIHSVLRSTNVEDRFKTYTSRVQIDRIENGQAIAVQDVVSNLGASYADDRTLKFENIINTMLPNKGGTPLNPVIPMVSDADMSLFIQKILDGAHDWTRIRTDKYNAYADATRPTAKAETKLRDGDKPVLFIDPTKLIKINVDFFAVLAHLETALPNIEIQALSGMTGNRFAVMCDRRAPIWDVEYKYLTSEQIPNDLPGEIIHQLYSGEIMGEFTCFNRMVFKTA